MRDMIAKTKTRRRVSLARRPPLFRRYKLYFYTGVISPETRTPHKIKNGKTIWYDVVDAIDTVHARRMGKKRHPDLICVPVDHPRQQP